MTSALAAFLIKLPLALAVFAVVAYAGTTSKRIAGVLFTFPILNGIAIIASREPAVVADAIYPLVIFNCALFALLISFPHALPPLGALPRWSRIFARVTAWSAVWLAGAFLITQHRAAALNGGTLLAGAAIFALVFMGLFWSRVAPIEEPRISAHSHGAGFLAFWSTRTALWRIVFFVATYACLFFAARAASDEKWVGMASALPLPGLFALASLIDDAETRMPPALVAGTLRPIRDTLFLGPLLVIPFNWTFAHALLALDSDALRYLLLLAMWAVAALAVVKLVPRLAAYRDQP